MGKVVSQSPPEEGKGKLWLLLTGTQPLGQGAPSHEESQRGTSVTWLGVLYMVDLSNFKPVDKGEGRRCH